MRGDATFIRGYAKGGVCPRPLLHNTGSFECSQAASAPRSAEPIAVSPLRSATALQDAPRQTRPRTVARQEPPINWGLVKMALRTIRLS